MAKPEALALMCTRVEAQRLGYEVGGEEFLARSKVLAKNKSSLAAALRMNFERDDDDTFMDLLQSLSEEDRRGLEVLTQLGRPREEKVVLSSLRAAVGKHRGKRCLGRLQSDYLVVEQFNHFNRTTLVGLYPAMAKILKRCFDRRWNMQHKPVLFIHEFKPAPLPFSATLLLSQLFLDPPRLTRENSSFYSRDEKRYQKLLGKKAYAEATGFLSRFLVWESNAEGLLHFPDRVVETLLRSKPGDLWLRQLMVDAGGYSSAEKNVLRLLRRRPAGVPSSRVEEEIFVAEIARKGVEPGDEIISRGLVGMEGSGLIEKFVGPHKSSKAKQNTNDCSWYRLSAGLRYAFEHIDAATDAGKTKAEKTTPPPQTPCCHLQADLQLIIPPECPAYLAFQLARAAKLEKLDQVALLRLKPDSIANILAKGVGSAELLENLAAGCVNAIPDVVKKLVDDADEQLRGATILEGFYVHWPQANASELKQAKLVKTAIPDIYTTAQANRNQAIVVMRRAGLRVDGLKETQPLWDRWTPTEKVVSYLDEVFEG